MLQTTCHPNIQEFVCALITPECKPGDRNFLPLKLVKFMSYNTFPLGVNKKAQYLPVKSHLVIVFSSEKKSETQKVRKNRITQKGSDAPVADVPFPRHGPNKLKHWTSFKPLCTISDPVDHYAKLYNLLV